MKQVIPCAVLKTTKGEWLSVDQIRVKDIGMNVSNCVTALYNNHADSSHNSNLAIEVMKIGTIDK